MRGDTDQILMMRISRGCRDSFGELLERYWGPLVSYASGFAAHRDEAEDIVQEGFIRVWRRREAWQPEGAVSAYLYRITRNLALNARRRAGVVRRWRARALAGALERPSSPDPHQLLVHRNLTHEVEAAIQALPERRREVFILSRFHRMTHQEIAQTMGISSQTVANQMSSALADLRKRLSDQLR
jgi:RNA polymerase sigma-70 factor (ECF subfamily)